jgi:hypothetical protein
MVYLALIQGADGIGYYSYNYVSGKKGTNIAREQPELWQEVKQINSEIAEIRPLLLEGTEEISVALQEGAPEIEFRALRGGRDTLLLLANTASVPKTAVLSLPFHFGTKSKRSLKDLWSRRVIVFEGSEVTVSLEPYQALGLIE